MAKELKQYKHGENLYLIGHWSVDKALETLAWLTKTFGEGFLSIFMSEDGEDALVGMVEGERKVDKEKEKELIREFASSIVDRLDPKEYAEYARRICAGIKCNGADIDYNTHFMGRMGELHAVLFHILRHQYGDFLGESESGE